jgi:hypothetical protein
VTSKPNLMFVSAVSLALTACGPSYQTWQSSGPTRYCVDGQGVRVPDNQCNRGGGGGFNSWYYMSRGGYVPYVGDRYDGHGSFRPAPGYNPNSYSSAPSSYATARSAVSSSVTRGGFGSSARGFGGGGR